MSGFTRVGGTKMFASGATATTPIRDGAVYTPAPLLIAAMQKFVDMGETSEQAAGTNRMDS